MKLTAATTGTSIAAALVALVAPIPPAIAEAPVIEPLEPFEPYLGRTWKALVNPDSGAHDVARWQPALAGQAIKIEHSVSDGAYGGETFIMWDRAREELVFFYFTTAGFFTTGTMWFDETGALNSREQVTGNASGVEEVHARQEIMPDGRLKVTTRMLREGQWEDRGEVVYREDSAARVILPATLGGESGAAPEAPGGERVEASFDPETDLISLHYDHAPDRDDGQSAAADRTILESMFDADWIKTHTIAVSGAYGENAEWFNADSDAVMDAVWKDLGGWLAGHVDRAGVVAELAGRWTEVIQAGGDVWVKEGGQSDITADAVKRIRNASPEIDTRRIHVVQHSGWNEDKTTDSALEYVREHTHYIRIPDANAFLNLEGGHPAFSKAASEHPKLGPIWKAAFAYYPPSERLDFSDTGELMRILGLGEIGIDEFQERFLDE